MKIVVESINDYYFATVTESGGYSEIDSLYIQGENPELVSKSPKSALEKIEDENKKDEIKAEANKEEQIRMEEENNE